MVSLERRANIFDKKVTKLFPPREFGTNGDQAIGKWQIKGSCFCLAYPGRIVLGDLQYEKGQYTIQGNSINIGLQNIGNVTNAICEIKSKKTGPQISHTLQQDGNQVQTIHCCKEGSNTSIYFQVCEGDLRLSKIDVTSEFDNTICAIYNAIILATCPNVMEERAISCLLETLVEQEDVDFTDILTKCWRDTPEEKSLYFASKQIVEMSSVTPHESARVYWYLKSNACRMFDLLRLNRLISHR